MWNELLIIIGWDWRRIAFRVLDIGYPGISSFEGSTVLGFLQLIEVV
jgi:hypothetical protein